MSLTHPMWLDPLVSSLYPDTPFMMAGVGPIFDGAGVMAHE